MLFLPWRDEEHDLIKEYQDFTSHYRDVANEIREQESMFTANLESTYNAMEIMDQHGAPEHAWDQIAPENLHNELADRAEGIEIDRPMAADDLIANADLIMRQKHADNREIMARYNVELEKSVLDPNDYRSFMRGLNKKQREIVTYNRRWCKNAVKAWKNNEDINPYRIFLSGPGGVGKSHVIKLIQSDMQKILRLSHRVRPTDVTVLVTAPTGVAAYNVDGMTIHSALLLKVSGSKNAASPLTFDKLNTLRSKLENLTLIIIDEISMVGTDMLLNIHHRLNKIKGTSGNDVWFGNTCILACGDLYQLPPVQQRFIFNPVSDAMAKMHGSGSIFMDEFYLHELTEIMRQKDDLSFANMLGRIRTGKYNENDIRMLKSREIKITDPSYPKDALHVFAFNKDVNAHNMNMLNELAKHEDHIILAAVDDKYDSTGAIDISKLPPSKSQTETGGLETVLRLAVGAKVMMTVNIDTTDGLVNSVMGKVKAFKKNSENRIDTILVEFNDKNVGVIAKTRSRYRQEYPNCVAVERHKGQYSKHNKKGAQINRIQFPLTLAWAVTIHKCQGLTLNDIVVDMNGASRFNCGQAYVAFSRVKSIKGLHLLNFDPKGIKTNSSVKDAMSTLQTKRLPVCEDDSYFRNKTHSTIAVGHLNIHYFLEKQNDLMNKYDMYKDMDIMCFSETYLENAHNIASYLKKFNYTAYRSDISNVPNKYGVMICLSSKLVAHPLKVQGVKNIEICAVSVQIKTTKFILCSLYMRPSLTVATKTNELRSLLSQLPEDTMCVITGDFNHDLLREENQNLAMTMIDLGFVQHIHVSTTDSGTLLDHIYWNRNSVIDTKVFDVHFSDHDLIAALINIWNEGWENRYQHIHKTAF